MKTRRGISLITLVITIVIIVILAGVVVLNITKSNPLNNASEAVFKENVSSYRDELEIYKGNQYIKDFTFNEEEMNYPSSDIDQVIKSMDKKDKEKFVISKGQLCYNGDDEQEKEWARELGIEITSSVIIGLDTAVNKNSVTLNVNVREGNNYTYTYEIVDVEKIEDITEKTYTFNNLTLNKKYIAKVIVKYNGNEEELSKEFTTSQDFDLEITSENLEVNLFEDITTTFTATLHPNATYKWYYNDTEIAGETSNAYSISTSDMDANNYTGGKYKVEVTLDGITQTAEAIQVVKPLEISTANELKTLAIRTNDQGITFKNDTITQTQDIDLSSVCSESLGSWTPIGDKHDFNGTYDGNKNIIKNIYIQSSGGEVGLFDSNCGIIKNLNIENANIKAGALSGGIAAKNFNLIENCKNLSGNIIAIAYENRVGGITGANLGKIINCENHSNVNNINEDGHHLGGIVGFNGWENQTNGYIERCINYGKVTGDVSVGGIVGTNYIGKINNCHNEGTISGNIRVAGISGANTNGDVTNSYNLGIINGKNYCVAGIVGENRLGNITNCYNDNAVGASHYVAGIIGYNSTGNITNCYNNGKIEADYYVAGICGFQDTSDTMITISKCYNLGEIIGRNLSVNYSSIAGILAYSKQDITIDQCYNAGDVTATTSAVNCRAAGIADFGSTISKCVISNTYNIGNIKIISTNANDVCPVSAGLIAQMGYDDSSVIQDIKLINSYNAGEILMEAASGAYIRQCSIAGWTKTLDFIEKCFYLDTSCDKAAGDNYTDIDESIIKECDSTYMKSQEFVDELGTDIWELNPNGYPVFNWQ